MNIIFVDFDDTLCVHPFPIKTEEHLLQSIETACDHFYANSRANEDIIAFLDSHKKKGTRIILLSACNSKMIAIKEHWCDIHCPGIFDDFIGTSVDLSKTQVIKAYAKYYQLQSKNMILIDDNAKELAEATEEGIVIFDSKKWLNDDVESIMQGLHK